MCDKCYAATAKILRTVFAAGASAFPADNADKLAKLQARGQSVSDDDIAQARATERAVAAAAEVMRVLTSGPSHDETAASLDGLLLHDPELRIDPEALINLCRFAHYASGLFRTMANITITACQARATEELDRTLVGFTLGNEGREIENARQEWNRQDAAYDGITARDPHERVAMMLGTLNIDQPGYATPREPEYKH